MGYEHRSFIKAMARQGLDVEEMIDKYEERFGKRLTRNCMLKYRRLALTVNMDVEADNRQMDEWRKEYE